MLKKTVLLALVVIVVALGIVVVRQPTHHEVTREIDVKAPSAAIFAAISDFHHWDAWSPWAQLDSARDEAFHGSARGSGAVYEWSSDAAVRKGRMTIVSAKPSESLVMELEILKPWKQTSTSEIKLTPLGKSTRVTWTVTGQRGFWDKAFSLFVNMDQMIGFDLELGLKNLKLLTEGEALRAGASAP